MQCNVQNIRLKDSQVSWCISQPWEKGSLRKGMWCLNFGGPGVQMTRQTVAVMKEAAAKRLTEEAAAEGELMQYGNTRGDPKYRIELAKFLTKMYGAPVDRDDILCTAGATHGLYTLCTQLFKAGDIVFVEDPTYFLAQVIFRKDCQFTMVPVPTDDKGMDMEALDRLMTEYKDKGVTKTSEKTPYRSLIYLVPCFQNPTSRCMAPERCQRVVQLARKHESLIVCDDVYNTLSWIPKPDGSFDDPPQGLFAYDKKTDTDYKGGHVVSNGSFSKFMGPGLRLGWYEAPTRLHAILREGGFLDSCGGFNQFTGGIMGTAMELELVEKHINNIRKYYQDAVGAVCQVLRQKMPKGTKFHEPQGGFFIWIELPDGADVSALRQICMDEHKIAFLPGHTCSPEGNYQNCLRISFSYYPKEELVRAVTVLCEAATKMLQ
ncbi:2-aminoadipate transaminase-like [Amphiura filiformis]|uniref:2-aminoadipate transaminase-like n=1 Tax=Amphiura filiformis TaxID=82378 RepID=UPI003B210BC2